MVSSCVSSLCVSGINPLSDSSTADVSPIQELVVPGTVQKVLSWKQLHLFIFAVWTLAGETSPKVCH